MNDSPPEFDSNLYKFQIAEDVNIGHEITKLVAKDPDEQGTIVYAIVEGGDDKFFIEPITGNFSPVFNSGLVVAVKLCFKKYVYNDIWQCTKMSLEVI